MSLMLALAAQSARAAGPQADELPADGQNALSADYEKWNAVWSRLVQGQDSADPANTQHQQAIDAAAKWATYRLTWGLEKDAGKINEIMRDFTDSDLIVLRGGKDKAAKTTELFIKQVIVHAVEVTQTRRPVARINAARLLALIPDKTTSDEKPDEVLADVRVRLAGTNAADLADAYATIINDPNQIDAARYWAFRGLRLLLALPQPTPPTLPREKEEAALGAVIKWLQDRNSSKLLPPTAPVDELDGFRLVRREAIRALAQGRAPTLADKSRPAWLLLKIACRDGIDPPPRLDERVEAAIGVAHALPDLDKDYQADYAAHQLGLFVAEFVFWYGQEKQGGTDKPVSEPWKVLAGRLIEALEQMQAQSQKNAHVTFVVQQCSAPLKQIEKALATPNAADLEQSLQAQGSPSQQLYKGVAESTVKPANRRGADEPPPKPEEKKDK
jgi:hypothetical protein